MDKWSFTMTRYRPCVVLLLFLLLNLTACQTWHSVSLGAISPAQFIEEDRPDRVRVTGGGVVEQEVEIPAVDGDQLVGVGDFSMPLEDILRLEVRGRSDGRTLLLVPVFFISTFYLALLCNDACGSY